MYDRGITQLTKLSMGSDREMDSLLIDVIFTKKKKRIRATVYILQTMGFFIGLYFNTYQTSILFGDVLNWPREILQ